MFRTVAEELSLMLVSNKIISIENRKYYIYGIELVFHDLIISFSILTIAIVTRSVLVSLFFAVPFCVLRAYAGGYHAKTHFKCFCFTMANYLTMLILNRIIIDHKLIVCCVIIGMSTPLIIKFAPVEHKNNPLSNEQKEKYKIISMILLILIIVVFIITAIFSMVKISFAISWAVFEVSLLLFPTIHLNRRRKNENIIT